jgi:hypothetical protein
MKFRLLIALLLIITLQSCSSINPKVTEESVSKLAIRVQKLIDTIDSEVAANKGLPELARAIIELSQTEVSGSGAGAKLVVSLGHSKSNKRSNSLKLVLIPIEGKLKPEVLDDDLLIAQNIVAALKGVKNANSLKLKSLSVSLAISQTVNVDGGLDFEFMGAGIDIGGEISKSTGNTVTLVFEDN